MTTDTLLNRYLQAIAILLPADQRTDILAELCANLTAEMEERQSALGQPLTELECAEILRQHGHPMGVAARYFPHQQLIGPPWIALYWLVLKVSLAVSLAVTVLIAALQALTFGGGGAGSFAATVFAYPSTALSVFAWLTLIFISLDYFSARGGWLTNVKWDPRKLPSINLTQRHRLRAGKPMSQFCGSIFNLALLAAWLHWLGTSGAGFATLIRSTAGWPLLFELLLAGAAFQMFADFVFLLRTEWYRGKPAIDVAVCAISLLAYGNWSLHNSWLKDGIARIGHSVMHPGSLAAGPPSLTLGQSVCVWAVSAILAGLTIHLLYSLTRLIFYKQGEYRLGDHGVGDIDGSHPPGRSALLEKCRATRP